MVPAWAVLLASFKGLGTGTAYPVTKTSAEIYSFFPSHCPYIMFYTL